MQNPIEQRNKTVSDETKDLRALPMNPVIYTGDRADIKTVIRNRNESCYVYRML